MRLWVICDDYWHPARTARAGLAPLEGSDLQFDWLEDAGEWSAARLADYPLVLLTKSNNVSAQDQSPWMTPQIEGAFVDYVRRGGGLLVIHSGTANYKETPALRALLGGVFDQHPPQCDVTVEPLPGHTLAAGGEAFTARDEHYFMLLDDVGADVFLTTRSEHGAQPGGWTRTEGMGRVCVLTPGHNPEVWLQPAFQQWIRNAIAWCVRSEEKAAQHA
jgi:type 1 glutamine amidotransferase